MFEEEQKLKKGQSLSSMGELDKILLGSHGGLIPRQQNNGEEFSDQTKKPKLQFNLDLFTL